MRQACLVLILTTVAVFSHAANEESVTIAFYERILGDDLKSAEFMDRALEKLRAQARTTRGIDFRLAVDSKSSTNGKPIVVRLLFINIAATNVAWNIFFGATAHVVFTKSETGEKVIGYEFPPNQPQVLRQNPAEIVLKPSEPHAVNAVIKDYGNSLSNGHYSFYAMLLYAGGGPVLLSDVQNLTIVHTSE